MGKQERGKRATFNWSSVVSAAKIKPPKQRHCTEGCWEDLLARGGRREKESDFQYSAGKGVTDKRPQLGKGPTVNP